ncbi:flagellar hook-associated protein FlgK [Thermosulfurimonas marina]|uniref:Flagellar hook-associated protein 1 n=1 Tax=Thermosulfurimonas marina TaxID=2047767 RepID=A0A6H1WTP7_9BACT|nr:flagellar hook-associated protein FlgK [Thermosulfurimonas marina]QJA06558.1 flagellar hook-associated protein FlgK [Thermosulfurimonas marina]
MAGISSALNIAKNALLAFQTQVHVTSHNVANVDTEGYSRQRAILSPFPPSPSPVGPIGSGVKIEEIKRYFDAFLEASLNLKRSELGLFSAEETGLKLVENIFNETQDTGLSRLLNDFFSAWQTLSNRAEGFSERRLVVEKGKLLAENLRTKFQALRDLESNIALKLKGVVDRINDLAREIAELNLQITATETGGFKANDLRDQRDRLIAELSKLAPIRYFENKDGAYNVVLGRGFNLVDVDRAWELELAGTRVYWVGHQGERARLTGQEVAGGELGGWLRLIEQISDEWNHEYVSGTRTVIRPDGKPLTEDTTFGDLNIPTGTEFRFQGRDHFGNQVSGVFQVTDPTTQNIRNLLDEIERTFGFTVTAQIEDGRLVLIDQYRGPGELSFQFTQSALDFGRFDDPTQNYRVEELNLVGKLSLFAEELIRTMNQIHSQGVGLKFFSGELEGLYQTDRYLKNLPFFRDLNRTGSLFLWVKDPEGKITPVRVEFNLTADATLEEVAETINQALQARGFDTASSVRALVREGRLVFRSAEGWSFAFSNDTSGILVSAGINTFFSGLDAASIEVHPLLSVHPEYVAAARLDREAWRSAPDLFRTYRSRDAVSAADPVGDSADYELYVRFYDRRGQMVEEQSVTVTSSDTLGEVISKLDQLEGLRAYIDGSGHLVLAIDPNTSKPYAHFELGVTDPQTQGTFLAYLRDHGLWAPQYVKKGSQIFSGLEPLVKPTQYVADLGGRDPTALTFSGTLTVRFFDPEGNPLGSQSFIPTDTNGNGRIDLEDLVTALDGSSKLKAYTDNGKLVIALENPPTGTAYFVLEEDDKARSWGRISLDDGGSPYELTFTAGTLENWLYDKIGNPLDTDPHNAVVDPFRVELTTDQGLIQLVKKYNAVENQKYGLSAEIDTNGRLLVKTTGLYDTASFVLTEAGPQAFATEISSDRYDPESGTFFFITDLPVSGTDTFDTQTLTVTYRRADGTVLTTQTINLNAGDTLNDLLAALNALDADGDGVSDFSAGLDDSGRFYLTIKDPDQDGDGAPDLLRFSLTSDLTSEEGNPVAYLGQRRLAPAGGLLNALQGFDLQPGDNRNALRLADLSQRRLDYLGEASLPDYYASVVAEVGVAGKRVSESKSFLEDLLKQLQLLRDSVSAVSLDEEMANLMKYQQAFAAAAKVLTASDEMLHTLIEAKR